MPSPSLHPLPHTHTVPCKGWHECIAPGHLWKPSWYCQGVGRRIQCGHDDQQSCKYPITTPAVLDNRTMHIHNHASCTLFSFHKSICIYMYCFPARSTMLSLGFLHKGLHSDIAGNVNNSHVCINVTQVHACMCISTSCMYTTDWKDSISHGCWGE